MCTVTWVRQADGYHLLCNRDEKRTRAAALSPRVEQRGGVRFIAPVDGDFGGTWIAANESGVSLCLLNGVGGAPPARRSRGLLLHEMIPAKSASACTDALSQLDLSPFAPFTMVILEPERPAALAEWDGNRLALRPSADSCVPLTSSSYDPAGVRRVRLEEFRRRMAAGRPDPATLYWFHASHQKQRDAYSPCMHRADAETVSFSWVVVAASEVRFFYSPSAPCRWAPGEQQSLARAA